MKTNHFTKNKLAFILLAFLYILPINSASAINKNFIYYTPDQYHLYTTPEHRAYAASVLGIDYDSITITAASLRLAHKRRRIMLTVHPDKHVREGPNAVRNATIQAQEINAAYDYLTWLLAEINAGRVV